MAEKKEKFLDEKVNSYIFRLFVAVSDLTVEHLHLISIQVPRTCPPQCHVNQYVDVISVCKQYFLSGIQGMQGQKRCQLSLRLCC